MVVREHGETANSLSLSLPPQSLALTRARVSTGRARVRDEKGKAARNASATVRSRRHQMNRYRIWVVEI